MFNKASIVKYSVNGVVIETAILESLKEKEAFILNMVEKCMKANESMTMMFAHPCIDDTDEYEAVIIQIGEDPFGEHDTDSIGVYNYDRNEESVESFTNFKGFCDLFHTLVTETKNESCWTKK